LDNFYTRLQVDFARVRELFRKKSLREDARIRLILLKVESFLKNDQNLRDGLSTLLIRQPENASNIWPCLVTLLEVLERTLTANLKVSNKGSLQKAK
jgi:hypothetical protein